MNTKYTILVFGLLLFSLPALAIFKNTSYNVEPFSENEKCSLEIENLKLCVDDNKTNLSSDEPVKLKLKWINSSDTGRYIRNRPSSYSVTVRNEKGKKLIPIFQHKQKEREQQMKNSGELTPEQTAELERETRRSLASAGSNPGIYVEPNQSQTDEIRLTKDYDYNFTAKGKYYITITKKVPSLEKGQTIEFVIDNIEIEVK